MFCLIYQHWGPATSVKDDDNGDGNEGDDGETKVSMEYDPMAPFANPVQRKKKKELDLSRWRELVLDDNSSEENNAEENLSFHQKNEKERKGGSTAKTSMSSNPSLVDANVLSLMKMDVKPILSTHGHIDKSGEAMISASGDGCFNSVKVMELDNLKQLGLKENVKDTGPFNSIVERTKQESLSLESQIDAENRARLQEMSPDEIAQAQAEIMEKLDPSILKALKKRGENKLKKQKGSTLEVSTYGEQRILQNENNQDAKGFAHFDRDSSHMVTTSNNTQSRQDNGELQKSSGAASCSSWSIWSDRVEAVRELRFSLDGDVVENDYVQVPGNGKAKFLW